VEIMGAITNNTEGVMVRNASALLALLFCYSCWNFQFFTSVATAFINYPLALRYIYDIGDRRRHHNDYRYHQYRSHQKISARKRHVKHTEIDNILSTIGLQQVKARVNQTNINNTSIPATRHNNKKATGSATSAVPDISLQTQLDFARNGHCVLRNFILDDDSNLEHSSSLASGFNNKNKKLSYLRRILQDYASEKELKAWIQKVEVAKGKNVGVNDGINAFHSIHDCQKALQNLGVTDSLPFLQYFNTWRKIPAVRELAFALGEAASILLDVPTARLYQDAIFLKRNRDGPTPWHVDAKMAPFDTSHMITFWIPLEKIPHPNNGGTALIFCSKSHADFALSYWNPPPEVTNSSNENIKNNIENISSSEWDRLDDRYPKKLVDYMPMNLGDVTVHSGWTLHCSNGNEREGSNNDRIALAITYVDGNAEVRPDWQSVGNNEDRWSYQDWCKEVTPRKKFSHKLVPIVWPSSMRENNCNGMK